MCESELMRIPRFLCHIIAVPKLDSCLVEMLREEIELVNKIFARAMKCLQQLLTVIAGIQKLIRGEASLLANSEVQNSGLAEVLHCIASQLACSRRKPLCSHVHHACHPRLSVL